LLAIGAGAASAQDTASIPCVGQRIRSVVVRASAPTAAYLRRIPVLAKVAAATHVTTHKHIIEQFLLLHAGDRCQELRRVESERILRAQPFLADASVYAVPADPDQVDLVVETTDEVAVVLEGTVSGGAPFARFVRFGNSNVSGQGIYLAGDWHSGGAFRDGFGARYADNQVLGRPYTLSVEGRRLPLGSEWETQAAHPFYTDIQRIAWQARVGAHDDYVQFANDEHSSHGIRLARNYFDIGGIVRLGPPGRLSLFGASFSGDDERPGTHPVLITDHGFAVDTGPALAQTFAAHRIARVNLLWGVRDIGFRRVRGFDALTATQDFPVGFQFGTEFGRSLSVLGSRDDDIFMSGDLYAGAVGRRTGLRAQLVGEGRRDNSMGEWDGLLAAGRVTEYVKFSPRHTTLASLEFSGGWRQRVPFRLTLSDPIGGVHGYAGSDTPGGQRLVGRFEHRVFVARPHGLGDLGIGGFVESGRLWAGDVPYGENTSPRTSVGLSVLAAVPPASSRMWRVDLAFPVNPEQRGRHVELRVSNVDRTAFVMQEPSDVRVTREPSVPVSVFHWP
jgi:hypothetical protein